ncbi:MAG TPA: DNA helicase [Rhodoglobus sp.]|nr:DNA helicase [Rhodoglobus sp.]
MALSRKRRKELKRLRNSAEELWQDQKELLDHAAKVVREATRQAGGYARDEVAPKVRDTYEDRIVPAVGAGFAGAKTVAGGATANVTKALGTALAAIEVVKDKQLKDALKQASRLGRDVGEKVGVVQPKPAMGPGGFVLIGLGVVLAGAVAYVAWQTLRADDDLWIEDEVEPLEAAEGAPPETQNSQL